MNNLFLQRTAAKASDVQARPGHPVSQIAMILNECLAMLDRLGLTQAATHLSAAIESLPGEKARLPVEPLESLD